MRNITRLFFLFTFLISGYFSQAQNIVSNPASTPGSCDGYAQLLDSAAYQSWNWMDVNQQVIQSGGSSVYGLCYGINFLQYTDSSGTNLYTFYVDTLVNGGCFGFGANVSTSLDSLSGCYIAAATIYGGTAPYSCVWSDGSTPMVTTICVAGEYVLYASDNNGCSYTTTFYLYNDTSNVSCSGFGLSTDSVAVISAPSLCDGYMEVSAYGGDGNYTYSWSNLFVTTNSVSNVCAGSYSVTVTDGNGCSATNYIYMYPDTSDCSGLLVFVYNSVQPSPNSCDGMAQIGFSGGSGDYSVTWNNGAIGEIMTGLCTGAYHGLCYG